MLHRLYNSLIKSMKKIFYKLFSDNNNINEKAIVGFISFFIMVVIAIINMYTAYKGIDFEIHEFVYDSFVMITLGALGIGSIDKFITRKNPNNEKENNNTNDEELG